MEATGMLELEKHRPVSGGHREHGYMSFAIKVVAEAKLPTETAQRRWEKDRVESALCKESPHDVLWARVLEPSRKSNELQRRGRCGA